MIQSRSILDIPLIEMIQNNVNRYIGLLNSTGAPMRLACLAIRICPAGWNPMVFSGSHNLWTLQ
jgi:hypothetical protein